MNIFEDAKRHSMERIAGTPVSQSPFPHIYVQEVFPEAFYAEMRRHLIPTQHYTPLVNTGRVTDNYNPSRLSLFPKDLKDPTLDAHLSTFWKNVFATYCAADFTRLWLQVFADQISDYVTSGQVTEFQSGVFNARAEIFLMRDLTNYALGPHTDSPAKLVSVLFYLPPDRTHLELGTSFYAPKAPGFTHAGGPYLDRALFDLVGTAPYAPNTLLAFPKSMVCFHGVEPVTAPDHRRDILLFDIKHVQA